MRPTVVWRVLLALAVGLAVAVSACSSSRPEPPSDLLSWDQGSWDTQNWQ